ncbi:MAG: Mur ligase family protein [Verrucomicrobiales bacterium]
MRLSEVIKGIETTWLKGSTQVETLALTSDLWRVRPGTMYFVAPDSRTEFEVELAMERGAIAIVTESEFVPNHRATMIQVPNVRNAMAHCARNFHGNPSAHLAVIGVTGSAWPQKFSPILKQTLAYSGIPTGLLGSVQVEIGARILPALPGLEDPLEIHQILAEMVRAGCKACVMEISEDQLPNAKALGLAFHSIIGGVNGAIAARTTNPAEIFDRAPAASNQILALYPHRSLESPHEASVLLLNGSDRVEAKASDLHLGSTKTSFFLHLQDSVLHCDSKLPGRTNVHHLLAAAGAASILKVRPSLVTSALRKVKKIVGNMQRITSQAPFDLFIDSARTPSALHQTLSDLREFSQGRIITVFGASGKTSEDFRRMLGKAAAQHSDFIVLTSDNPGNEEAQAICEQIAEGFDAATPHFIVLPRETAIQFALREAKPGDVVLIAGKGEKTYQEMESTIVPFDDGLRAKEALNDVCYARTPSLPRSRRQRLQTTN